MKLKRGFTRSLLGSLCLWTSLYGVAQENPAIVLLDMPAQPLNQAVVNLASQAGLVIGGNANVLAGYQAPPIKGEFTADEALQMLLNGTGIRWRFSDNNTVILDAPLQVEGRVLDTVKVTASAPKEQAYSAAGSVSVVTREEMDRMPLRNASDLFVDMPGVSTVGSRQNPGVSVNIRGLQDFGRVNVMIDGARQNYQQTGHGANGQAYIDTELLSSVTVSKGPNSTAGGAAMIGGMVDFKTLEIDDLLFEDKDSGTRINLTSGTNAYHFSGSVGSAYRINDNIAVMAVVSRKNVGAFEMGKHGTVALADDTVQFSDQDQQSVLLKTELIYQDHLIKLSYMDYSAEFATGSPPFHDLDKVKNQITRINWLWEPVNPLISLDVNAYYTKTTNEQFRPDRFEAGLGGYGSFDVYYETATLGGSAQNRSVFMLGEQTAASLVVGGEFFVDKTSPNAEGHSGGSPLWFAGATPEGQRDVFSSFAQIELQRSIYEAIFGLRYDYFRLQGNGLLYGGVVTNPHVPGRPPSSSTIYTWFDIDRDASLLAPKVTLAVNPTEWLKLYTSYGEGIRPPAITETMLHGTHVGGMFPYYPNPTLIEERSRSIEVGANFNVNNLALNGDKLLARLAGFDNKVENFMSMAQTAGPADSNANAWAFVNLKNPVDVTGIEFQADYDAQWIFATASYTWLDFDWGVVSYDPFPLGSQVGYPPPAPPTGTFDALWQYSIPAKKRASGSIGVRLLNETLTLGLRSRYVAGGRNAGTASERAGWSSYTLFDAWAAYQWNKHLTVRLAIDNLRDKAYAEAMGSGLVVGPGQTASLTFNITF